MELLLEETLRAARRGRAQTEATAETALTCFIVAGETSGDALAASVLRRFSTLSLEGVIGPKLRELGAREFASIEEFQVIGFIEILKSLPHFIRLFYKIRKAILQKQPDIVLLVDNAEFSLLMAKSLRKKGFSGKIVQLVSPSIWAWRKNRIKTLEENYDLLLSIFPFEKTYFLNSPLRVEYIGHPLLGALSAHTPQNRLTLSDKPIIALFPGSRKVEILKNLPLQLKVAQAIPSHQIAISVASEKLRPLIEKLAPGITLISSDDRFELMQKAQFALSKFGTTTLELAFFQVPTITACRVPAFELFLLEHIFKVFLPHYSLVNLVLERRIFPEYIASFATEENLTREAHTFATNPELRRWVSRECAPIKKLLAPPNLLLDI